MASRLFEAQLRLVSDATNIVDVGTHHGHSTEQYAVAFPKGRIIGIEPDGENFRRAEEKLGSYSNVELIKAAVADAEGALTFHPTSHDGSHSLLEVVEASPHFEWPVHNLAAVEVPTVTLDGLCAKRGLATLDVLKMDIQGGELLALQGAVQMLGRGAIRVIALEVLFKPLYRGQPLFWDLAAFLRSYGYDLQGLYDVKYNAANPAVLRWADAIFVSPEMQRLNH